MQKSQVILIILLTYLGFLGCGYFAPRIYQFLLSAPLNSFYTMRIQQQIFSNPYPGIYWNTAKTDKKGVSVYMPDKAYDGLTLFTSSHEQAAYLIDMQGKTVHQWTLNFADAWPDAMHIQNRRVPDDHITWGEAHVYPNGDLLMNYYGIGAIPWGYGMVKMDKDSKILWKYDGNVHHDIDITPDGKIYTLTHDIRNEPYEGISISPPYLEDFIVVLNPDGSVGKKISIYNAFKNSPAKYLLGTLRADLTGGDLPSGDPLHTNAIEIIRPSVTNNETLLKPGLALVSFRSNSMLALIDLEKESVTWASYGPWHYQHDPDVMTDGTIMLFDNQGHLGEGGASRLLRFDPSNMKITWTYTGTDSSPMESTYMGRQETLPNSNILITESNSSRIFEITQQGEIVWEYFSPWRFTDHNGRAVVPNFLSGKRYSYDDLPFLKQ